MYIINNTTYYIYVIVDFTWNSLLVVAVVVMVLMVERWKETLKLVTLADISIHLAVYTNLPCFGHYSYLLLFQFWKIHIKIKIHMWYHCQLDSNSSQEVFASNVFCIYSKDIDSIICKDFLYPCVDYPHITDIPIIRFYSTTQLLLWRMNTSITCLFNSITTKKLIL